MPKKEVKNKEKKVKQVKDKKHFLKDTKAELKKVIWPTPKQLLNNTLAVIAVVLIIGIIVFLLDFCFEKLNSYGVNKLKSVVQTNTVNQQTDTNSIANSENATNDVTANAEAVENQAVENAQ